MKKGQILIFAIALLWIMAIAMSCAEDDPQPATTEPLFLTARANKSCDPDYYAYLLNEKEWTEGVIHLYQTINEPEQVAIFSERLYNLNTAIMLCGFSK